MTSTPNEWTRTILESPYSGNVERNRLYAVQCLQDMLKRGEAPFASHLLYPKGFLEYSTENRDAGMRAAFAWTPVAQQVIVYTDLGLSSGMIRGIARAEGLELPVIRRKLGE